MKNNLDCMRDVLSYIYSNIDEKEKIMLTDLTAACKDHTKEELESTTKHLIKSGMITVMPVPRLVITDITADGITCMRNLME